MSSYLQTFLCGLLFCHVFLAVSEVQMFAAVEKFEYLYYIGYYAIVYQDAKISSRLGTKFAVVQYWNVTDRSVYEVSSISTTTDLPTVIC